MFVDPAKEDYRVRPESPALKLGFQNFDMTRVGLLARAANDTPGAAIDD